MEDRQRDGSANLIGRILSDKVAHLADDIRGAATECHSAVTRLALRGEVQPNVVAGFAQEINDMLAAVTRIANHLLAVEARIKSLSQDPQVKRYFTTVQLLETSQNSLSPAQRQSLESERGEVLARARRTLKQLREDVRTLLILRLEMFGYWKWFLKKAIEVYTAFKGIVRDSLRGVCDEIQDPVLRELVTTVLSADEGFPTKLFDAAKQRFPTSLSALEQQAVKELEDLSTIESRLAMVKTSATDLENSECFIHEEIHRSAARQTPEGTPLTKQTLLRGLEEIEEPEKVAKRPRIFQVKRSEK